MLHDVLEANWQDIKDEIMLGLKKADCVDGVYAIPIKGTDMVVTFQVPLVQDEKKSSYAVLGVGLVKDLGVSEETMFREAVKNGVEKRPVVLRPLECMLMGSILGDLSEEAEEEMLKEGLVFASCKSNVYGAACNVYGAACLLYPGFLKMAGERLGGGFYVLPSSVHELLLLPEAVCGKEEKSIWDLREMVRSVNENEVEDKDRLSDEIYYSEGGSLFHVNVEDGGTMEKINLLDQFQ